MKDLFKKMLVIAALFIAMGLIIHSVSQLINFKPQDVNFNLKQMNDSLIHELNIKDSLLEIKEKNYIEQIKKDSIKLQSINNSINNLFYEIKKQTQKNYSIPDSMYQFYVDSIRTNKGFYKIQH